MASSGQYEVTADKLCFREKASSDSERLATLEEGTAVTVLSTDDGWAKARWNGKTGYLSVEYLERVKADCTEGRHTTKLSGSASITEKTPLYQSADTSSKELATLSAGTDVSLRGETMKFYYVKADGKTGYVLKSRTGSAGSASAASSKDSKKTEDEESGSGVLTKGMRSEEVRKMQERLHKLGYLDEGDTTGYFGSKTDKAVRSFQTLAGLEVDGVAGAATLAKLESGSAPKQSQKKVVEMDWFDTNVSSLVKKRGGTASIIDCDTGIKLKVRRVGGSNHMDLEPATKEDTEKLLKIYHGHWSWSRRSVILIAGGKYIAASINGMPHGAQISKTNDYDGQFCLHTTNSRTHGTDRVDKSHQDHVKDALSYHV